MKRHINIPLFIQHMGCPNQCVFCDQRAITAAPSFCLEKVREEIESVLKTAGESECEIAFFGGSFTGIDRKLMIELLDIAESYVKAGKVCGIRMSTRPDYISEEICDILDNYTISQVELGIQSMDDKVLFASKRGHTAEITRKACELLKNRGYSFVGQMMVGLPEATRESEIATAIEICKMGAEGTRIYPLVVFKCTELKDMAERGEYIPLTLEEAVERSADVYEIFLSHNVKCLKIGLHENEN
ncbi:MAG: radical SAM protein, partial [Clostridia bacterium]|nr:radical SAM protein [Clostridia bacterium]